MSYETALIDGSGFAKAAYTPGKRSLCHRFLLRVYSLLTENAGIRVCVAWDPADNVSERVARFADYKVRRRIKVIDRDYLRELRNLFELLPLLGVDQAWSTGWEADDVLGTMARSSPRPIVVLTRDRDMMQLVEDDVHVLMKIQSKQIVYTPARVLMDRGIHAELITDWKALAGDSGDDVPGMEGIGPKTATEILQAYPRAVQDILGRSFDCPANLPRRTENLLLKAAEDPERLRTMRWLVELHDVPLTFLRGRRDLKTAKRELRNSGLRVLSSRVRELED